MKVFPIRLYLTSFTIQNSFKAFGVIHRLDIWRVLNIASFGPNITMKVNQTFRLENNLLPEIE